MTFWIIAGGIGTVVVFICLLALALCAAARVGDDLGEHAHRDEAISQASLYPTRDRDVHGAVINYMRGGLTADRAVRRAYEDGRA